MTRDFQRQRVYDWEKQFIYPRDRVFQALAKKRGDRDRIPEDEAAGVLLTLEACQEIVTHAYALIGRFPGPTVTDGRGRRRGGSNTTRVKLPRWTRFPAYVLHEAAHYSKNPEGASHGPEFVARLIELLVQVEGHDLVYLIRSARTAGVKVAERPQQRWHEALS